METNDKGHGKKWRVLIADDDEGTVAMLKCRFDLAGFDVLTAYNGAEAVNEYEQSIADGRDVHFCVLDYEMPALKGDVAAVNILQKAREASLVSPDIVIFTGSTDANLMLRLQTAEIGIALIKPQGLRQLEKIINRFEREQALV